MKLCPVAAAMYADGMALAAAYLQTAESYECRGDEGRASGARVQREGALRGMTKKLEKHRYRCHQCG